jgi:hypothetical protein
VKEIIIVCGAVIFERHHEKNFKISIGFVSLQGKPVLLVPWMVYTLVYLIASSILYIVNASQYFAVGDTVNGAGNIVGVVICICK